MIQNLKIKTVTAILLFALAACSGGGYSGSENSSANKTKGKSEKIIANGYSGDLEWKIVGSKLILTGEGKMGGATWYEYRDDITAVEIENGVENICKNAFENFSKLTAVNIPNTVETIEKYAFSGCRKLKSITIPYLVNDEIDYRVFQDCENLTSINVDENNSRYYSDDGVLIFSTTKLILYPAAKPNTAYTIPNSVTVIGDYAFSGSKYLKSVTIPGSVQKIGYRAFSYCNLTEVTNYAIKPQSTFGTDYEGVFCGTKCSQARLRVPANSKEAYEKSRWSCFGGIVAIPNFDSDPPQTTETTETTETTRKRR